MIRSLCLIFAAALAVALTGCTNTSATAVSKGPSGGGGKGKGGKKGDIAAPVTVAKVVEKTVPVQIRVIGSVEPYSTVSIRAQVAGELKSVHFHEGDFVKTGDLLFTIDARTYEAQLRQIEANLARDEAALKQAQANLGALAPLQRQAFLLVAVEGFSEDEAAEILEMPVGEFAELLTQASTEVSRQMATDILIIEDEPLIAMDIEEMVESLGHRVVGVARTHAEATELFRKAGPKMVLADIQLADGSSGIDAVNEILATARIPVIFITAFPERLLTGERPEPTFLVTKPFAPEMVKALISQALFFDRQAKAAA